MIFRRKLVLLFILFSTFGVMMIWYGYALLSHTIFTPPEGKLWLKEGSIVEPSSSRVAWGVTAPPRGIPNYWYFKIRFRGNASVSVNAFWDDPSNLFYNKYSINIDTTKIVKVINSSYQDRWTWYIKNDNPNYVMIDEFIVEYSGADKPYEDIGRILLYFGIIIFLTSYVFSYVIYLRKH